MKHSVAQIAVIVAGAVALVGPAHAEWSALQRIKSDAAACADDRDDASICGGISRVDVDIEGLRLWHPWRDRAGLHVEADQVRVGVDLDGVVVDARGLAIGRSLDEPVTTAPNPPASSDPTPPSESDRAPTSPARRALDTFGIPVSVRVHGPTTWSGAGIDVVVDNAAMRLDGHGGATAQFALTVGGRGLAVTTDERWSARAIDGDPRRWRAEGTVRIADGPPSRVAVTTDPSSLQVQLRDDGDGTLWLEAPRSRDHISAVAQGFSLATLGKTGLRTLGAWGVDSRRTIVHGSGSFAPDPQGDGGTLAVDELSLSGLVIDQPKLARTPVQLDGLAARGQLRWQAEQRHVDLWLAHRDAEVTVQADLDATAASLRADLAPLSCQALVDSVPAAMADMTHGTRFQGQIEGFVDLKVDRTALGAARAETKRAHDATPPGALSMSFPFLEQCTVIADDPRLDMAALSGPYRHRFVDHDGRFRTRLMARGGPGFVALSEVPLLARAFVSLEDRRFWSHDGFDRDQIVNAFWHNLVEGRVRRGASTISQQAARNLWLGVDRSWGRKLQEALLTARLEATTSKVRVMELYLNIIELGPGVHGVDDAAHLYFGKPASKLNALQAVHIAALAPAPNRFAAEFTDGHVDAQWLDRLRDHVRRMHRAGFISRAQMNTALRSRLGLLDRRK